MKPEIKKLWTDALRSGEYKQRALLLHMNDRFCCLGVLCDLAIKQGLDVDMDRTQSNIFSYDGLDNVLPLSVIRWSGLDSNGESLAALNDGGASFSEIADVIEQHF